MGGRPCLPVSSMAWPMGMVSLETITSMSIALEEPYLRNTQREAPVSGVKGARQTQILFSKALIYFDFFRSSRAREYRGATRDVDNRVDQGLPGVEQGAGGVLALGGTHHLFVRLYSSQPGGIFWKCI